MRVEAMVNADMNRMHIGTTHNNLNSKLAPSLEATAKLPGPNTRAAVMKPGPSKFQNVFLLLLDIFSIS